MAQVDTGMGWEADEEWLISSPGVVAVLTTVTGAVQLKYRRPQDANTQGLFLYQYPDGIDIMSRYLVADTEYLMACLGVDQGGGIIRYYAISRTFSKYYRLCTYKNNVYQANGKYGTSGSNPRNGWYNGWYSATQTPASTLFVNTDIPVYSDLNTGLDTAAVTDYNLTKANSGFAVAAVVRYTNEQGNRVEAPFLISTVGTYADFNTPSVGTPVSNAYRYSGMVFTCTRISGFEDTTAQAVHFFDIENAGRVTTRAVFEEIMTRANVVVTAEPTPPYDGSGSSEPGGGDSETVADDKVGIIHNPYIPSALGTGLVRAFCPTDTDLNRLRSWLWDDPGTGGIDLDDIKRLFVDPMDNIVGLSVVPISITGPSVSFSFGGVVPSFTLPKLEYQYYQVSCGYVDVGKKWGAYLDYEPYTEFYVYLPFIGIKPISADEIMGKQVILDYDIDVISGSCLARLQAGQNLLYSWSGQCAMQIPINARNWDSVFATAIQCATQVATGIASGGSSLLGGYASASVNALTTKARIQHSGVLASTAGWMGNLTPYLIRINPVAAIPEDQNKFIGYPSWTTVNLGSLVGYNVIDSIHLENIPATDEELTEIEEILKGGAIF